jgi:hypothetical protein
VFAGVAGADQLFAIVCLVVLLSVVIHGAGSMVFLRRRATRVADAATLPTPPSAAVLKAPAPVFGEERDPAEFIELTEVKERLQRGEPLVIADARAERSYNADDLQAQGAVRIDPEDPVRSATEQRLAQHASLVVYCA